MDTLTNRVSYVDGDALRQDLIYNGPSDPGADGALKGVYVGNTATYPTLQNAQLMELHKVDNLGRDTAVRDSLGHGPTFEYEGTWGNLWKSRDPTGVETRFTYDNMGRTDSTIVPLMGASRVTYGSMNQVLTQVSPGYLVTNTYDSVLP